ncbi:MAG: M6 family metalloprotease domain-containing protein [Chloroflexi bacterium]|nr:M6 family metalloprotease domain-containing protein [Chloroflexota bacterium]
MYKKSYLSYVVIMAFVILYGVFPRSAFAAPAAPFTLMLTQPNGETFAAVQFGDEWENGYETLGGYTIVQSEFTEYWYYAMHNENGKLVPSYKLPASNLHPERKPPQDMGKHLRDESATVSIQENIAAPIEFQTSNVGTQQVLVLLATFSNQGSVGSTEAQWNNSFYGATNSVKDYYDEVSYGQLTLNPPVETFGTANNGVVGWLNLGYPHPNTGGSTGDANRQITKDAILASNPYINYANYDTDNDGYISTTELHVIVIVAGYEASYSGSPAPSVWGHRWSLGFGAVAAPAVDGVVVGDYFHGGGYAQFGEWHGSAAAGHKATMGIMVHELGHDLSWPDLYDTNGGSNGVGRWSVMGSGSWLGTTYAGDTPSHVSAWEKWYQDWLTPVQLKGSNINYPLPRVETNQTNAVVQLLDNPDGVDWNFGVSSGTGEFFLVENRQQVGYDAALPGCGLLIWHIDETRTSSNDANANEARKLIDVEEADGQNHLDNQVNRGDAGDLYPGSSNKTSFDDTSNPNSDLYDNSDSGISVTNISAGCADIKTADFNAPGTNTGTIIVEKQTNPDGASDNFTFTGDAAGTISDNEQIVVDDLSPGTYTSQEVVPAGWNLSSIACDDTNSSGSLGTQTATFELEAGEIVVCTFTNEMEDYTLTIDVDGNGSATAVPDQATYHYGDMVEITAVPDDGWTFTDWGDDIVDSNNPILITITGDMNISATFTQDQYFLYLPLVIKD